MSTRSGSAKAGSESGLKVRLYAILSPVITVLMQRNNNCAQQEESGGDVCCRRGFPACINSQLALQAACRSRSWERRVCDSETKAVQNTESSRG
jgi:hypothetical protein